MNSDAALDALAFHIGLRLIGPDERRRLRIALGRDPGVDGVHAFNVAPVQRLDDLLMGRREPASLQDRMDMRRAERERTEPSFTPAFWIQRTADLTAAGFSDGQAEMIIAEVRKRVEAVNVSEEEVRHVGFEAA